MILDLTLPSYPNIMQRVAKNETNDCAVLALHWAAGISYNEAHAIYDRLGRKQGEGATVWMTIEAVEKAGFKAKTTRMRFVPLAVADWIRNKMFGTGRVLVIIPDHVFAVVDGEVIDSVPLDTRTPVLGVIRLCRREPVLPTASGRYFAPALAARQKELHAANCSGGLTP